MEMQSRALLTSSSDQSYLHDPSQQFNRLPACTAHVWTLWTYGKRRDCNESRELVMSTTEHSLSVPDLAQNCNGSRDLAGLFLRKWSPRNRCHCAHQPRAPLPFFDSARDYWSR